VPKNSQQKAHATNHLNQHYTPHMVPLPQRMAHMFGVILRIWFTDRWCNTFEQLTGSNDLRAARLLLASAVDRLRTLGDDHV
jgi:hypothetical protein